MSNVAKIPPVVNPLLDALASVARSRGGVVGATLTTFNIGGALTILVEPDTSAELLAVLEVLRTFCAPYRILGAGSNLLISDAGVSEVVIRLGRQFRQHQVLAENSDSSLIQVGAAASLMTLSRTMSEAGLSGLEFAGGIPASLGGAVFMNAGAHGDEIGALLQEIDLIVDGHLEKISAKELPFSYRHSGITLGTIIVGASLRLLRGDKVRVCQRRAECLKERKARQPLTSPSAGSVFRNPSPQRSAGALIEECGLKGLEHGGAKISELHANWIINPKRQAKAADVVALIDACIETVQARTGIALIPEVVRW